MKKTTLVSFALATLIASTAAHAGFQDAAAQAAPAAAAAPAADATQAAAATPAAEAMPAATAVATANTSGLSEKTIAAVGTPAAGKGLVVFFRPSKFVGGAVGFKVREGEIELGKLRNGNYFSIEVEPGAHAYTVHSEAKDVTNIEVEAGETYFLSGSISMGIIAGRPNLSPSAAAAFEALLPKLKKSKPLE